MLFCHTADNYTEPIHGGLELESNPPYLMYTHGNDEVKGGLQRALLLPHAAWLAQHATLFVCRACTCAGPLAAVPSARILHLAMIAPALCVGSVAQPTGQTV